MREGRSSDLCSSKTFDVPNRVQTGPTRRHTGRGPSEEGSPTPSQHESDMPWLGDPSGSRRYAPFQKWAVVAGHPTNRLLPSSLVGGL